MVKNHNLNKEFPEFQEKIQDLRLSNHHFEKLYENYEELDMEIVRLENSTELVSDFYLEDLKKKRIVLKDELFGLLKAA